MLLFDFVVESRKNLKTMYYLFTDIQSSSILKFSMKKKNKYGNSSRNRKVYFSTLSLRRLYFSPDVSVHHLPPIIYYIISSA